MKTTTWKLPFIALVIISLSGCIKTNNHERMVNDLIEVDQEFARQSVIKGSHSAFLEYIDDSAVLLRPNRQPVVGRAKISEMFSSPDTSFSLSWNPLFADVSETGDFGYTYGIFTIQMDSPEGDVVTKEGTYVTIWKKDQDGNWKFVLDTGNQGLGNKNGDSK